MRIRRHRIAWGFIGFPVAIILVFSILPSIAGTVLSVFEWDGGGSPEFVGRRNYVDLFAAGSFWSALRNTLVIAIVTVPITVLGAFAIGAAVSCEWFHARSAVRTLLFLPTVISVVAIGFLWRWMLEPGESGLLNRALMGAGVPAAALPDWLGNSPWGLLTVVVLCIWRGLGFSVVLYLAALANVPSSLHEAAAVDGAGSWQRLWHVSWPSVRPMTFFLLVTGFIGALQVFDIMVVMFGTTEQSWTDVLGLYLYREFSQSRLGFASAIGVIVLALSLATTAAQTVLSRKADWEKTA